MAILTLSDVSVSYGDFQAVRSVSVTLDDGQIGCFLGPSGCGKTSLLRAIAGFERIASGNIALNGDIFAAPEKHVPAEHRGIGMVFQDFALFPHLSVRANISFGLATWAFADIEQRVDEMVELMGLTQHLDKFPHQLSGGQQQRVALARALAPKPRMLLMDEPFSNLDTDLRRSIVLDVRSTLKSEGITTVIVTHDQEEAFAVADVIGVFNAGQMLQWGQAQSLYQQPTSEFVAEFIGEGAWIPGQADGLGHAGTELGTVQIPQGVPAGDVRIRVRPEAIALGGSIPVQVLGRQYKGGYERLVVETPSGSRLLVNRPPDMDSSAQNIQTLSGENRYPAFVITK